MMPSSIRGESRLGIFIHSWGGWPDAHAIPADDSLERITQSHGVEADIHIDMASGLVDFVLDPELFMVSHAVQDDARGHQGRAADHQGDIADDEGSHSLVAV